MVDRILPDSRSQRVAYMDDFLLSTEHVEISMLYFHPLCSVLECKTRK